MISYVSCELPGLMRATRDIRLHYISSRQQLLLGKNKILEDLFAWILLQREDSKPAIAGLKDYLYLAECKVLDSIESMPEIYALLDDITGEYESVDFLPLLGRLTFREARKGIEERRQEEKDTFIGLLAKFFSQNSRDDETGSFGNENNENTDSVRLVFSSGSKEKGASPTVSINNKEIELPEHLSRLVDQITTDLGELPQAYVAAAAGLAGRGLPGGEELAEVNSEPFMPDVLQFDEWDYRRVGYRSNWCSVYPKELALTRSNFVSRTRDTYHGLLVKIRHQFEMIRTRDRFARRRRYGDDLDLDALIDSLGDQKAGLSPSERLFVRLLRDERDIATLFLVDMSNSTQGWIGNVIKEALVLLCEAMEVVGDRYGIYGFSGMRRSRCEVFHIKHIDEMYGDEVRERVGAISPREYTRMGPPIRYLLYAKTRRATRTAQSY